MSYDKHTWATGDAITARKLSEMEYGIAAPNALVYVDEDTNVAYLSNGGTRRISIDEIINAIYTCFRGDTTYVTMADGTKKLIKDVKIGDEVLGYDVNRKEYCNTIVIENTKTGAETVFSTFVMDDGTTIDIHGDDAFIANIKDEDFCDNDGDYISLYRIRDNLLKLHKSGDDTRRIIKDTGNLDNTTCVVCKRYIHCAELTPRFALFTANGTMFVNGLLHAQYPRDTISYFKRTHTHIPENIMTLWDGISASYAITDAGLPDDHIQHPEKVGDLKILEHANALITSNKNYLAATDYKAMKYAEGALTEEEWLPVKAQRAAARETINAQEAIVAEYRVKVATDNPEFIDVDPYRWRTDNTWWKTVQGILDAHAEDFRAWIEEEVNEANAE